MLDIMHCMHADSRNHVIQSTAHICSFSDYKTELHTVCRNIVVAQRGENKQQ